MGNLDPRLIRATGSYVALVALVVVVAQLGLIPGVGEISEGGSFAHPYRLAMVSAVLAFAVFLGALSAWAGAVLGGWHLGLAALIVGGVVTGGVLTFAPSILYPNDQYPVTFSWVMLGAPVAFATWLACSLVLHAARPPAAAQGPTPS
jgi:hypothetical protein